MIQEGGNKILSNFLLVKSLNKCLMKELIYEMSLERKIRISTENNRKENILGREQYGKVVQFRK